MPQVTPRRRAAVRKPRKARGHSGKALASYASRLRETPDSAAASSSRRRRTLPSTLDVLVTPIARATCWHAWPVPRRRGASGLGFARGGWSLTGTPRPGCATRSAGSGMSTPTRRTDARARVSKALTSMLPRRMLGTESDVAHVRLVGIEASPRRQSRYRASPTQLQRTIEAVVTASAAAFVMHQDRPAASRHCRSASA